MSNRNSNKRKKGSSKLLGSQSSSILDFFSQTKKEHAADSNKKRKLNQDYSNFESFTSTPFDQSQQSNATVEDAEAVSLSTQESSFELHPDTQNSHAWSEAISEVGDFDMAPFTFDLDRMSGSRNATQTDSVVSNFSDNSQLAFPPGGFIEFSDMQTSTRPHSVHSFISTVESPILSQETIAHFDDDDDEAAESIKSTFSTQEALPAPLDDDSDRQLAPVATDNANLLPPISDFKFVIPTSTVKMDMVVKQAPKPVTHRIKPQGITAVALKTVLQETEMHEAWEDAMNAQLAKHGNIAQVCKEEDVDAALFWILDSWIEGNVIFAWCTCMDEDDVDEWLSAKKADEDKEASLNSTLALLSDDDEDEDETTTTTTTTTTSTVKSCPDQELLNNMNAISEEKFLFAFSLAYIKSRKYAKKFIEQERVVAVWPDDWSELQITLPMVGHCTAKLTSKFKADSIY